MPEHPTDNQPTVGGGYALDNSATMVTTAEGWMRSVSAGFAAILAREPDAMGELNWLDLIHPDDVVSARQNWANVVSTRAPEEVRLRLWSSEQRWVDTRVTLRVSDAGLFAIDLIDSQASVPTRASSGATSRVSNVDIPAQRVQARSRAGGSSTPMIEIDQRGRTVYVGGDWASLVGEDVPGPDALEALLYASHEADAVMDAIGNAFDRSQSADVEIGTADGARRWVKVVPIPAPNMAGETNVLVGVAETNQLFPIPDLASTQQVDTPTLGRAEPAPTMRARESAIAETSHTKPPSVAESTRTPIEPESAQISLRERLEPVQRWVDQRELSWSQVAFVGAILLVALLLRTWDLSEVPTGFHGDEAVFGQEAQRVLDNGSIGIYTGSALGQPTAPFYLGAVTVGLFGPSIWATRISSAIAGVITVAAVYLIVQRRFDHRVASASALALATLAWSIHFSRIAFAVAWWPLAVLVAVAAIDRATRSERRQSWFAAGAISAFGVYVYNPHWSFGLAVLIFMAIWLVWPHRRAVNRKWQTLIWGPIGALIVLWPMLNYARNDNNGYFNHFDLVSRRNGPDWTDAGFFGKADLLVGWYFDAWNVLLFTPTGDDGDGSGIVAQVPLVFTLLAFVGIIELFRRHRTAFSGLMLVTLAVLPLGPSMTLNGYTRREFAMSPFIAILAGIGAVAIFDLVSRRLNVSVGRYLAAGLVAIVLLSSVVPYFTTFRNSERQKWVFAEELTQTVDIVRDAEHDGPVFVNWFSVRHYYEYSSLEFLLDGTPGIDRAAPDQGLVENPPLGPYPDATGNQLFVLIGDYAEQLGLLQQLYPDGDVVADRQGPRLAAFLVPSS